MRVVFERLFLLPAFFSLAVSLVFSFCRCLKVRLVPQEQFTRVRSWAGCGDGGNVLRQRCPRPAQPFLRSPPVSVISA